MKNSILFFFITVSSIAQTQITIQVSDNESKENIEFATILLPDYKKSFVTDEKGKFVIDTEQYKLPLKVIAEQFGFEQKEITLQNTTKIYNISLTPSSEILREIIIPPANAKIKERIYGRTNEGSGKIAGFFRSYNSENKDSGLEFGMILNTNNKLKKVKKIHWHIGSVGFIKAVYSLQFYEVENGKPTKRIPHADIHFTIKNTNLGWNIVNVENLDIYIDGSKKVAAILKTLKVDLNKKVDDNYLGVNVGVAAGNVLVARDSQFENWMKIPMNYPFYITIDSYE